MTTSFMQAFKFDASGYFEHELTVQCVDGQALMPPLCSLDCPWADGAKDDKVFYRFIENKWVKEVKPTCAANLIGVVISHESRTPHDTEMRELIQKFAQEEGYREKRGADLSWSLEKIPELTPEEKRAQAESQVRCKRDALISQTDYLLTPDYPITPEDLLAVKEYRTALRDVPQQDGFPFDVVWPELPSVLKK